MYRGGKLPDSQVKRNPQAFFHTSNFLRGVKLGLSIRGNPQKRGQTIPDAKDMTNESRKNTETNRHKRSHVYISRRR